MGCFAMYGSTSSTPRKLWDYCSSCAGSAPRGENTACPLMWLLRQPGRMIASAVPVVPGVFFQPPCLHLVYHGFSKQRTHEIQWDSWCHKQDQQSRVPLAYDSGSWLVTRLSIPSFPSLGFFAHPERTCGHPCGHVKVHPHSHRAPPGPPETWGWTHLPTAPPEMAGPGRELHES